jgi:hypothetical protein
MCFGFDARARSSRSARAAVSAVAEYGCQCDPTARSQLVSPSLGVRGRRLTPPSLVCVVGSRSASSSGKRLLFIYRPYAPDMYALTGSRRAETLLL